MVIQKVGLALLCAVLLCCGSGYASEVQVEDLHDQLDRLFEISARQDAQLQNMSIQLEEMSATLDDLEVEEEQARVEREEQIDSVISLCRGTFSKDDLDRVLKTAFGEADAVEDDLDVDGLAIPLVNAAYRGNVKGVGSLIELGADVNRCGCIIDDIDDLDDQSSVEMVTPLQAVAKGWGKPADELMSTWVSHYKVIKDLLKANSLVPSDGVMRRESWPKEVVECVKKFGLSSYSHPYNIYHTEKLLKTVGLPRDVAHFTMVMLCGDGIDELDYKKRIEAVCFKEAKAHEKETMKRRIVLASLSSAGFFDEIGLE